nr:MAG TPA: hypothetical protein [Caudoviricetes sp.]
MRVITVVSTCIAIFFAVKSWRTAVILRADMDKQEKEPA